MTTIIRKRRRGSALIAAAALMAGAFAYTNFGPAVAEHGPADKVVAAGSTVEEAGPGEAVTILEASLKTSKPTDLVIQISLECSIITDVTTGPMPPPEDPDDGPATDLSQAEGTVKVWVEIDDKVVPINSDGTAADLEGTVEQDAVTFCNRVHRQEATDGEDPLDGLDKYQTYLKTKSANAFNWLRLNAGSGSHDIVVKATLSTDTVGEAANAEAYIGNRSLIVEPTKLANDASI